MNIEAVTIRGVYVTARYDPYEQTVSDVEGFDWNDILRTEVPYRIEDDGEQWRVIFVVDKDQTLRERMDSEVIDDLAEHAANLGLNLSLCSTEKTVFSRGDGEYAVYAGWPREPGASGEMGALMGVQYKTDGDCR